jgi:hypothetical protein
MSGINRTYNPKWVTYWGDGQGRDGYIVFNNGGLNELRDYKGPSKNGWQPTTKPMHHTAAPFKEATAFDYIPDGSGRDSYVIRNFGLKRDYKSYYYDFEKGLRSELSTPMMD